MTKRGTGSNCFDNELLRYYYTGHYECFICGRNNATDGHHNIPRANPFTSSIINCIFLCRDCHSSHADLTNPEMQQRLFEKSLTYLVGKGYKLTELDHNYIVEYGDLFIPVLEGILSKKSFNI